MVPVLTRPHHVVPMVERHHALIETLRVRTRPVSGETLAREIGVRRRTVERDVARLRAAGVPVTVRRGAGGGYLLPGRRGELHLDLTSGEVAALVASLVTVGPSTSATAVSVFDKLMSALAAPEAWPAPGRSQSAPNSRSS